jgi:hypothetical protein
MIVPALSLAQPTLSTLTDDTGGTPATTLAAIAAGSGYSQADAVAIKNAISQLAASVNAIISAMINAGQVA